MALEDLKQKYSNTTPLSDLKQKYKQKNNPMFAQQKSVKNIKEFVKNNTPTSNNQLMETTTTKQDKGLDIILKALINKNTIKLLENNTTENKLKAGLSFTQGISQEYVKDKTKGLTNNINATGEVIKNSVANWGGKVTSATGRGLDDIYSAENEIMNSMNNKYNLPTIPKNTLGEKLLEIGSKTKMGAQDYISDAMNKVDSPVYKTVLQAGQSAIESGMDIAMGPLMPATMFARMNDSYYDEGLSRGLTPEQARTFGTIGATAEAIPSLWSIGKILKGVKNVGKESVFNTIKGLLGEGTEEAVMEPFVEGLTAVYGGKYSFDNIGTRMAQSFGMGVLSAGLIAGAGKGLVSCKNIVDKVVAGEKVSNLELEKAKNDLISSGINLDKITEQLAKPKDDIIKTSQQSNTEQENSNNLNQQMSISNNSLFQQSVENMKKEGYVIPQDRVDTIEKFSTNRGANVLFDNTLDNNINGVYDGKTRTYKINPNSEQALEFIAVHEMLHDMQGTNEYNKLSKLVQEYAENKNGYNEARNEISNTYNSYLKEKGLSNNNLNMDIETTNDMVAEALGNQEFINSLVQKPSVFNKIVNWIKEMGTKVFGTEETRFLQELKKKFAIAYKQAHKGGSGINYSIQQDDNGKYIKVDTDQDVFKGINEKDYSKIAKMYIEDYLLGKTVLNNDKEAIIDKKASKKYTNPGKYQASFSEKMKLTTELKNVLEIAKLDNDSLPNKPNSQYPKWEYYKFKFEISNNLFEGTINIGIDSNGNKHFYDINKIHPVVQRTSSDKSTKMYSINNSITENNTDVNSYSMQNSGNNTQELENTSSFSLPKLQKGYIRLYRGLENEYNPNYDRSKLDNSNGYESWTDNYELAKAYGNNVYYIDIPANEIKNSIVDEDSNSETYGDRNFIYKNDKPVGIKGKNGNEFMLYTDHDNHNNVKYNKVEDIQYSQSNDKWQQFLKNNFDLMTNGTKTYITKQQNAKTEKIANDSIIQFNNKMKKKDTLNDIAKLTKEDADTTPKYTYKSKDGDSKNTRHFYENVKGADVISKEVKKQLTPTTYEAITNKESMDKAYERLTEGGQAEVVRWLGKSVEQDKFDSIDIAEGFILLNQTQANGDMKTTLSIIDKLADLGTKKGQELQMYSVLKRLTPEGMTMYATQTLERAYEKMSENRTKEWCDNNKSKFKLTEEDATFIKRNMEALQKTNNQRKKDILLAEISKRLSDKLPPETGQGIKAYMRISMLFNLKTQVRNVLGNAGLVPINAVADTFATLVDKAIAKKTGVRTTNFMDVKAYVKGFKKGAYETIDDFQRGINTNMMGNRYEIKNDNSLLNPKSFNENTNNKILNAFNQKMNSLDKILSTSLTLGDRPFYEASFLNSIEGQIKANNVKVPSVEMVDIAVEEALQRTWQDNNEYTQTVLSIRRVLNKMNVKGYGLGDVLIPFAKTPANLTKAIVKYSPANAISTIISYNKLNNAIKKGEFTPQLQKKFVDDLGKTFAGSLLYIIGYGIAQSGIISGGGDEDKDIANYNKNVRGIQPYSFKIGDTSFTYNWLIPATVPFAIMADLTKEEKNLAETLFKALQICSDTIVAQSFMASINKVITDYDGMASGVIEAVLDLPARAIPTVVKQVADMVDDTARTTYVKGDTIASSLNYAKSKIPFLSKTLPPAINTMGKEVKKYGGDNNIFNVFLNPANVTKDNSTNATDEIYRVYEETGNKNVFPKLAPNYFTYKKEKIILTPTQKEQFQRESGNYITNNIYVLTNSKEYKKATDEQKGKMIENLIEKSYDVAKTKFLQKRAEDEKNFGVFNLGK